MTDLDGTLIALSDPTRRGVIDLLRRKPRRAGELSAALEMSPAAMSRHLRVLRTHGLVEEDHAGPDARVRIYRLRREPFRELRKWLDDVESARGPRTFEVGKVTLWDPPRRLELEWRGVNFKPGEKTSVEVTFTESASGTLVTVRHRGWSSLPEDHPVRHGLVGPAFSRMIGLWWGQLMTSLREHVETRR